MHDAELVRRFQRFGNLPGNAKCFIDRNRPLRDTVGKRRAFDQLHHEGADVIRFLQPVDLRDVGMVQRGERLRLALEARQPIGVTGKGVGKNLEGDWAIEVGIERSIDFTHPASPDFGGDLVRADSRARRQGHGIRRQL